MPPAGKAYIGSCCCGPTGDCGTTPARLNIGSINPGVTVSSMPKYPAIGDDYAPAFAAQKALPVDVFFSSHAAQFGMHV